MYVVVEFQVFQYSLTKVRVTGWDKNHPKNTILHFFFKNMCEMKDYHVQIRVLKEKR